MPPSGTRSSSKSSGAGRDSSRGLGKGAGGSAIGKSSSKGGVRGPTGPQGQARTSPAGGKAGSVTRTPKSEFQRFQERYPNGTRSMNVKDIPSPMPGGFGPAGNAVRGVLTGARGLAGRLTGQTAAATKKAKQVAEIEKKIPRLERMKQSEAVRLGKTSQPGKLPDKLPPMALKQIREANKPFPGYKTWSRIQDRIDDVTQGLGFGRGEVARGLAAGVTAGVGEGSRRIAESALDGFKRGGLVKKSGNFKRKKK